MLNCPLHRWDSDLSVYYRALAGCVDILSDQIGGDTKRAEQTFQIVVLSLHLLHCQTMLYIFLLGLVFAYCQSLLEVPHMLLSLRTAPALVFAHSGRPLEILR